jgi:hypothetical protein
LVKDKKDGENTFVCMCAIVGRSRL